MNDPKSIKIEILKAEEIKPEVRKDHKLPDFGLVIKSTTRTSPSTDSYELLTSPFIEKLNESIQNLNPALIQELRKLK